MRTVLRPATILAIVAVVAGLSGCATSVPDAVGEATSAVTSVAAPERVVVETETVPVDPDPATTGCGAGESYEPASESDGLATPGDVLDDVVDGGLEAYGRDADLLADGRRLLARLRTEGGLGPDVRADGEQALQQASIVEALEALRDARGDGRFDGLREDAAGATVTYSTSDPDVRLVVGRAGTGVGWIPSSFEYPVPC